MSVPSGRPWLTLALLSAAMVPQVGLGVMVPASARLAQDLHVGVASVQNTLVVYMVGYAVSVIMAGLLSDRFGPRAVQLGGLVLAMVGALLAASAEGFTLFILGRLLQSLGGCVSTVTTRLVVREVYPEAQRLPILSILASAIAVTPCVVPLLAGAVLPELGWRGVLLCAGAFNLLVLLVFVALTRPMSSGGQPIGSLGDIWRVYRRNMGNPDYRRNAACISLVWMSYFALLSSSSHAFQQVLGFSELEYGALIGACACGYVAGSTTARRLSQTHDLDALLALAAMIGLGGCIGLSLGLLLVGPGMLVFLLPMIALLVCTGMVIPITQAGLLRCVSQDVGLSSGQFFFLQMMAGALYSLFLSCIPPLDLNHLAIAVAAPVVLMAGVVGRLRLRGRLQASQP
ncbi:MFS transporter [Pseudomonas maumuensis]|uniref:MFS transporter n=1 Tax=Pseudomonas maumuensis TaxID=2842354 RepID=A0ABX8NQN2_9PSED|nr:MFS transporter [Pseudomonas maumuensis]QXH58370.1 MFS transporter [Pseudomonas maumuensis]